MYKIKTSCCRKETNETKQTMVFAILPRRLFQHNITISNKL